MTGRSFEEWAGAATELVDLIERVVLGQHEAVRSVVATLISRGHVLLEGVPGTAKTLLVRTLGLALDLSFRRIQFTPDLMPSDITGISLPGDDAAFVFRPGPLFGDFILADEINRAPAKTQAALLEAMQERSVTVDGTSHPLSSGFTVFATQNPIEFEGTYPLPEAELDRFMTKVLIDYPADEVEQRILQRSIEGFEADDPGSYGVSPLLGLDRLVALQKLARSIKVEPTLLAYVTAIVRTTRGAPSLVLGASPRASIALLRMAQSTALLSGRDFVIPDDVKSAAPSVLRHRIVVAPELELEGVTADRAVQSVLEQVAVPS